MSRPIPTNIIIEMNRRGFNDFDIIRYLRGKGYTPVEINDAMNHAKIKIELAKNAQEVEEDSEPRARLIAEEEQPEPQKEPDMHKELFDEILSRLKNMEERNKQQERSLEAIKEQLPKVMQQQYSSIKNLNAEVQALQQTFSKVLEPLAHNVKVMSGMLDMPKEEKAAEKVEKEIKREEKEIHKIELKEKKQRKPRKKTEKVIKKTVTITEIQEKPAKKTKKKGSEPGLEDIF